MRPVTWVYALLNLFPGEPSEILDRTALNLRFAPKDSGFEKKSLILKVLVY